jgi:hypothetical protein
MLKDEICFFFKDKIPLELTDQTCDQSYETKITL